MKEKMAEHQAAVSANRHLHDMEKINLVGMLSSMIAHELRQPLTVIQNYIEDSEIFFILRITMRSPGGGAQGR